MRPNGGSWAALRTAPEIPLPDRQKSYRRRKTPRRDPQRPGNLRHSAPNPAFRLASSAKRVRRRLDRLGVKWIKCRQEPLL